MRRDDGLFAMQIPGAGMSFGSEKQKTARLPGRTTQQRPWCSSTKNARDRHAHAVGAAGSGFFRHAGRPPRGIAFADHIDQRIMSLIVQFHRDRPAGRCLLDRAL